MLSGEAELVSELTGLSGKAKSVQRFERRTGNCAIQKLPLHLPQTCRPLIHSRLILQMRLFHFQISTLKSVFHFCMNYITIVYIKFALYIKAVLNVCMIWYGCFTVPVLVYYTELTILVCQPDWRNRSQWCKANGSTHYVMGGDIILEGCSHEHIAVFVDPEVTGRSQLSHNLIDKFTLKQHPMFLQTDTLTFSSTSEQIFTFETDLRFKKKNILQMSKQTNSTISWSVLLWIIWPESDGFTKEQSKLIQKYTFQCSYHVNGKQLKSC